MAKSKRKASALAQAVASVDQKPSPVEDVVVRRTRSKVAKVAANPDANPDILDGAEALRASPDRAPAPARPAKPAKPARGTKRKRAETAPERTPPLVDDAGSDSPLSEVGDIEPPQQPEPAKSKAAKPPKAGAKGKKGKKGAEAGPRIVDPEAEYDEPASDEDIEAALTRPPPVNSDYLPLPWKGRLGYACLNTYLRNSTPPVFSSRTCRIASILENRHPLQNPDEPPHPTKNRPDKNKPPSVERGQAYVEALCLANVRDIIKMLEWNDKYGIKFMRLSSEMFPFASHEEYGYKLAPFASEALAEAGKVAAQLGHRLTTHPGQFTQLGSPRKQVIDNAIRDLDYHAELLSLLKLPPQQDRDAVMILHLGGVFGDKAATLDRFRANYARLSPGVKKRLVLENDDVSWCVHELLPICEELNIPFVLDFHHHNIVFDNTQIREGTKDIIDLFPRILQTWKRKGITPKMHYSEPTEAAVTPRQRRKHSPRVAMLPPCPPDMDLMIEAKDKEQAVFELMRKFKLPGHERLHEMTPHVRRDDNKNVKPPTKKELKKIKEAEDAGEKVEGPTIVPEDEVGMGGPDGQVYWPPGQEEWLRPVKRVVAKKAPLEDAEEEDEKPSATKKRAKALEGNTTEGAEPPVPKKKSQTVKAQPEEGLAENGKPSGSKKKAKAKTSAAEEISAPETLPPPKRKSKANSTSVNELNGDPVPPKAPKSRKKGATATNAVQAEPDTVLVTATTPTAAKKSRPASKKRKTT